MKTSSAIKIKTGIFVIAGIGVILLGVYLIGKNQKLFGKSFPVYAEFKNVSGLQVGNFVRFAGINVGIINSIVIKNDTIVRVDFSLEPRMKPFLRSDAVASISSNGLMGDKLVQIAPGTDSGKLLAAGSLLKSTNPVEMDKIISKVSRIADNAESVTAGLSGIVDKINSGQGSIGMLLRNDTLAKRLESTVSSAKETVGTIRTSAKNFNENMEAAKHNFLLRGYFRKKEKRRLKDSVTNSKTDQPNIKTDQPNNKKQ